MMAKRNGMTALNWRDDEDGFEFGGVHFRTTITPNQYHSIKSEPNRFLLVKNRDMLEKEMAIFTRRPVRTMLDIGIWQGGSVAFFDLLLQPQKLVALELRQTPIEALTQYVDQYGRNEALRIHYGVNQADTANLRRIIDAEFGDSPIDVVIDDASHQYEQTKASFDVIFPYLAPGGYFVIEDWGWSFTEMLWTIPYFEGKAGVSNLIVQCMALAASRPDLIEGIELSQHLAIIKKGGAAVEPGGFSTDDLATNRGEPIPAYF
jgi:hypothetical protein